jgi:branched-chain amino acid aminotransferase
MRFVNFNGKFYPEHTPLIEADSRAFRYGDGIFETLKFKNGEFILLQDHLNRLWQGIDLLQFEKPKLFTKQLLRDELSSLVQKNKDSSARIRLSIFRGNGGLYDPENLHPNFILQSMPLNNDSSSLNSNGLQLCIYRDALKVIDQFSNIKHNNYLPYLMGALFAKASRCNDALILNNHANICDSSIANIFIVKDNIIYTPALTEGPVAGVMRKFLLEQIPALGIAVAEATLSEEMLLQADEVFLSNSIYNIRWVAAIGERSYTNLLTQKIFNHLAQTKKEIFC